VETAVVSLLLITILLGIVETSFLFKDWISVSAAARAGARMGASQPLSPTFGQDSADQVSNALSDLKRANIQEVWVYKADTSSTVQPAPSSCASSCLKYSWNTGTSSLTYAGGTWASSSQNACPGDPARDSIGVYVKYRHASASGLFFSNATVSESTVMMIEPWTSDPHCGPGH